MKQHQQKQQPDSIGFVLDPYDRVGRTEVSNALIYGEFPVRIPKTDGSVKEKGKLSKPARLTYLGLRSFDWDGKGETHYTWAKLCKILDLARRTLALHLEELEGAGLIRRAPRTPDQVGGTFYYFNRFPLREVWRALLLKKDVTGFLAVPETIMPDGSSPATRAEFNRQFDTVWWPANEERCVNEFLDIMDPHAQPGRPDRAR